MANSTQHSSPVSKTQSLKFTKLIFLALFLISMVFPLLRFINLQADMPTSLVWDGSAYTDEGIYARNASYLISKGDWYVPGDLNTAVNYPVYFLVQIIFFKGLGINFESVRLLSALCALGAILLIGLIVRKNAGNYAAVITVLLISSNYLFFGFSRFGQADMLMLLLIVLSLACLLLGDEAITIRRIIFSSLFMLCALLAKTSAIFAVPLPLFLMWQQPKHWKSRIQDLLIFLTILALGLGIYRFVWIETYFSDYQRVSMPLKSRFIEDPFKILQNIVNVFHKGKVIGKTFYQLSIVFGLTALLLSKSLRQNRLFQLSILWYLLGMGMLVCITYHPPRYFSHLVIPLSIIVGLVIQYLWDTKRLRLLGYLLMGLVIVICIKGQKDILEYIASPQFSIPKMGQSIKQHIKQENLENPLILGHLAGNVSLATQGIPSAGAHFDDAQLSNMDFPFEKYHPTHFVELGPARPRSLQRFQEKGYQLKLIETYDVLGNVQPFHVGQPVYFYRLFKPSKLD